MESTGTKNKIHLSSETANRLIKAGRQHWVVKRDELTHLKGKGDVQTYWLHLGASSLSQTSTSQASGDDSNAVIEQPLPMSPRETKKKRLSHLLSWKGTNLEGLLGVTEINESLERLVKWNVDVLLPLLKNVVAYRISSGTPATTKAFSGEASATKSGKVLDDVQLFIDLPKFNASALAKAANEEVELIPEIKSELHDYVMAIASGYKMNSFHNFEHASHVILSASKLLKRIMAADDWTTNQQDNNNSMTSKDLHEHTYGIGTDPLTHFAVVFSALIHDVGHEGVPNARLMVEKPATANRYNNKCIAEQQSVDIAWELLLLPKFENLRACIYQTKDEYKRFRHLVANSVIATDIFDKALKVLRQTRWDRAFGQVDAVTGHQQKEVTDTKATVVIEHVIQASDVSHCMQVSRLVMIDLRKRKFA
jgi:3'5'-cyclic nucleotide phosphodiesterase/Adenylate and Guanylate cyclase catalytic domain